MKPSRSIFPTKLIYIILTTSLTSCGEGGTSSGVSGGGIDSLNIQTIATISLVLGRTYNPTCLYDYGNSVFLINGNGSGTGYSLNLASGQISSLKGLPQINLANGDQCLPNYQQLTWINSNNPYIVNIFNPDNQQTQAADLSLSGIAGSDISKVSFNLSGSVLYANNNFLNNGSIGFSSFTLPRPTGYVQLDNALYANRNISQVLYGFDGAGKQSLQLLPTNILLSQAAAIAYVQANSGNTPVQSLSTITDGNNQLISAMSTAWDFTSAGNGVIVTTGLVKPILYNCPLVGAYSYQCNKTYTGSEFTTKYRIMRLLGGNASYVYFMGIDLTKSDIEIFSIQL